MNGVTVQLSGLSRVEGNILTHLERRAEAAGLEVARVAKSIVPVRTGRLRDSIESHVSRLPHGVLVEIGSSLPYARPVELGTSRQHARPFLRPALAQVFSQRLGSILNSR